MPIRTAEEIKATFNFTCQLIAERYTRARQDGQGIKTCESTGEGEPVTVLTQFEIKLLFTESNVQALLINQLQTTVEKVTEAIAKEDEAGI